MAARNALYRLLFSVRQAITASLEASSRPRWHLLTHSLAFNDNTMGWDLLSLGLFSWLDLKNATKQSYLVWYLSRSIIGENMKRDARRGSNGDSRVTVNERSGRGVQSMFLNPKARKGRLGHQEHPPILFKSDSPLDFIINFIWNNRFRWNLFHLHVLLLASRWQIWDTNGEFNFL